jgi:hypothetical protein
MTKLLPSTQAAGVKRAIAAARASGLRVLGIRPDGTVITWPANESLPNGFVLAFADQPLNLQPIPSSSKKFDVQAATKLMASGPIVLAEGKMWAEASWKEHVCASPMKKRERDALELMCSFGPRVVLYHEIKGAGLTTMKRLEARGFVVAVQHGLERVPDYTLTLEGKHEWERIKA